MPSPHNHLKNYTAAIVTENIFNAEGKLIVEKGACGLIVTDDRGRLMMSFDSDDSGKHITSISSNGRMQVVPALNVKTLSTAAHVSFRHTVDSYQMTLIAHLLHHNEQAALLIDENTAVVLMDGNQSVGHVHTLGVGTYPAQPFAEKDWNSETGNWQGFDGPHTLNFNQIAIAPISELRKKSETYFPAPHS